MTGHSRAAVQAQQFCSHLDKLPHTILASFKGSPSAAAMSVNSLAFLGEHPFLRQEFKQQQQLKAEAPFYLVRQMSQKLLNK